MSQKDDLHQLIQSLTKMEKRGFNIWAKRSGDVESNYYRLFDALNRMNEYDEARLRKKFKGEKLLKNLSKEKNYLFDVILKFMRTYGSERSVTVRIKEMLMDADMLYEKGLYEPAKKCLSNAKKLAKKYQHFPSLQEILMQERLVFLKSRKKEDRLLLDQLWAEKKRTLRVLQQKDNYDSLLDKFLITIWKDLNASKEEERQHLDLLLESPLLTPDAERCSFVAEYRYYQVFAHYYHSIGKQQEAYRYFKKVLECWQAYPHMMKEYLNNYNVHINNYISVCHLLGKFEEIEKFLGELKSLPAKDHQSEGLLFGNVYHNELMLLLNQGKCKEALELMPEIEAGLKKFKDVLSKSRVLTIKQNIGTLYFSSGNIDKANEWYDAVIKEGQVGMRNDLQRTARTIKIVLFYDSGKLDQFENYYRSVQRYFDKHQTMSKLEEIAYKFLKLLYKCRPNETKKILSEFHSALKDYELNETANSVGLGELLLWTKSKIKRIPICELLRNKARP